MSFLQKIVTVVIIAVLYRIFRRHFDGCICTQTGRFDKQIVLVTAADTELGILTVRGLARRGATVIMACSVLTKCHKARKKLLDEFGRTPKGFDSIIGEWRLREELIPDVGTIIPEQLLVRELHSASAASTSIFCQKILTEFKHIHALVMHTNFRNTKPGVTVDDFERHLGFNFVSNFLLAENLLPTLKKSQQARIVFVTSGIFSGELPELVLVKVQSMRPYFNWREAYLKSQLATNAYAGYLHSELTNTTVTVNVVNPGFEASIAYETFYWPFSVLVALFGKSSWQAAQTTLSALLQPSPHQLNDPKSAAFFFNECQANNPASTPELIDASEAFVMRARTVLARFLLPK